MFRRSKPPEPRARITADSQPRNVVFSYHANRSIRESSSQLERLTPQEQAQPTLRVRRRRLLRRLPTLAALTVITGCCLVMLSLSPNAKIISITSSDPSAQLFLRNTQTYQQAAQKLFASSALNRNKLTANATGVAEALQAQFPELQHVSIALPIAGHRPLVYIQPANPVLFLRTQGGGVYILDRAGRALVGGQEAAAHLGNLPLPVVEDESGLRVTVGQVALPSGDVNFIAQVVGQLQAKGLVVDSLRLPAASSEFDLKIKGANYVVRFNLQGDARLQAGTFLAAKQYAEGQRATPQYFDVRVPERAYYR